MSHRAEQCFARGKICHLCRTKGHIQRACSMARNKREPSEELPVTSYKIRKVAAISAPNEEEPIEQVKDNYYIKDVT